MFTSLLERKMELSFASPLKFSACTPNFSSFVIFTLFCISIINVECAKVSLPEDSSSKEFFPAETILPQKPQFRVNLFNDIKSGIETVNISEIGLIQDFHKNTNSNSKDNRNDNSKGSGNGTTVPIPTWTTKVSTSSSSVARTRTTKLLEKPLESQLISQFREPEVEDELKHNAGVPMDSRASDLVTFTTPVLSPQISMEKGRLYQRKYTPDTPIHTMFNYKQKRQDSEVHPEVVGESPESEIKFNSIVSPIEGSFGGLTGLQGLPPLSLIQFVKLLVAITPFIIPIIFIPLLIFTIGLLMIPVTRTNMFVDIGNLRSSLKASSIIPSFMSSFVGKTSNPIRGNEDNNSSALVALPRAFIYDLATKLLDTEECVERISCEISAKYMHSHWEQGNWRSIVNTSWISRVISYLWENHPTVSRIGKSLWKADLASRERKRTGGRRSISRKKYENITKMSRSRKSISSPQKCARYICQPKSFILKFLSSSTLPVSTSSSPTISQNIPR